MRKLKIVRELVRQWRTSAGPEGSREGRFTGLLLLFIALFVKWPKEPPRIEPFIYAHF